ncbi:hypothetical protein F5Y15DRAFT_118273 [Xylariaceae sp. FL0016]|nr:hypothetical protein F5Y15DRAFT_118273 [Xylariaceae sp. FL0016]
MDTVDMDNTWILNTIQGFLPQQTVHFLHDHVLHPTSPVRTLTNSVTTSLQSIYSVLLPVLLPLIDRLTQSLSSSPDIVLLGFVLAALFLVLQIFLFIQRTVSYVTRLFFRLLWWAVVVGVLAAAWQRGPEAVARDVVVVVSKVAGYAAVVRDIWWSEYQRYDAQTRTAGVAGGHQRTAGPGTGSRSRRGGM